MSEMLKDVTYPNLFTFKDSRVTSTVLLVFWVFFFVCIMLQTLSGGGAVKGSSWYWLIGIIIVHTIWFLTPVTTSTLCPNGVTIRAALSKPIFHSWSDISNFQVYEQAGYMFTGRRYLTFQDPENFIQKHVFLVPIHIKLKPSEVLETVKAYQIEALKAKSLMPSQP